MWLGFGVEGSVIQCAGFRFWVLGDVGLIGVESEDPHLRMLRRLLESGATAVWSIIPRMQWRGDRLEEQAGTEHCFQISGLYLA